MPKPRLLLLAVVSCVNAAAGKLLWQKSNDFADLPHAVANEYKSHVLDAQTGKLVGGRDLEFPVPAGRPALGGANLYASLALAGNHLVLWTDLSDTEVLEPGREFKELRRNRLGEGHGGAPAFAGKFIYLRSGQHLYCIGEK